MRYRVLFATMIIMISFQSVLVQSALEQTSLPPEVRSPAHPANSVTEDSNSLTTTSATSVGISRYFSGNPSIYGDIIAFSSYSPDPYGDFLMYYNTSTGVLTNTTIKGGILFPSVYQNKIAFIMMGTVPGRIGLYDVSTGNLTWVETPNPRFDIFSAIVWTIGGGSVLSLGDHLLAYYAVGGAWCYDRIGGGWTYLGDSRYGVSVFGDAVAFSNGSTICYYNATTGITTDTGVEGTNPSMFESIITFHRESTSPPYATIRYYNVTSGTETDTGIVGDGASIYADRIAFATNETFAGTDLNGDGELNASIIRFYDIWSGAVINTGETGLGDKWLKTSIYGDTIVFVDEFFTSSLFVRLVTARAVMAAQAAQLAISLIGAEYRHGKGWNWSDHPQTWDWTGGRFLGADEIKKGYSYLYHDTDSDKDVFESGAGVDCSGLVFWAYNKAYGAAKFPIKDKTTYESHTVKVDGKDVTDYTFRRNPVFAEGAAGQWNYNVDPIEKTDLKPGDLLFFDTKSKNGRVQDGKVDHVAMYVGQFVYDEQDYTVVESCGSRGVVPRTVDGIITRIKNLVLQNKDNSWDESRRVGFGRVKELPANITTAQANALEIKTKSPVTLDVTDPDRFSITNDSFREVENMIYLEAASADGKSDDMVIVSHPGVGDYIIFVAPKPDASLTDTYTLEVSSGNATAVLASNVSVSEIPSQPYIVTSNETAIIPRLDSHDIGIQSVYTSKRVIGQNYTLTIDVTIFNYGQYSEDINTTLFINELATATQYNVILESRNAITLTFAWNTSGIEYGNYTISAHSWPVLNETYISDNIFVAGNIVVTIPGDVNGNFVVDIFDAILLSGHYNQTPINPLWNANIDINSDNIVDIFDAIILANHYGQHFP